MSQSQYQYQNGIEQPIVILVGNDLVLSTISLISNKLMSHYLCSVLSWLRLLSFTVYMSSRTSVGVLPDYSCHLALLRCEAGRCWMSIEHSTINLYRCLTAFVKLYQIYRVATRWAPYGLSLVNLPVAQHLISGSDSYHCLQCLLESGVGMP